MHLMWCPQGLTNDADKAIAGSSLRLHPALPGTVDYCAGVSMSVPPCPSCETDVMVDRQSSTHGFKCHWCSQSFDETASHRAKRNRPDSGDHR